MMSIAIDKRWSNAGKAIHIDTSGIQLSNPTVARSDPLEQPLSAFCLSRGNMRMCMR